MAGRLILVTGATGKVGQAFMHRLLGDAAHGQDRIRALCHNRTLPESARIEVVKGSIADRTLVARAMEGVSHVLHLATCKETPEDVMDVTVKGLFWLLEAARESKAFRQFVLIGGDAGMGHFFYRRPSPVTEADRHSAYPGCYALSKVLEEVMLEQYYIQYDFTGCCLRAPWIMEKDDFKYTMSFGEDVFGGPRWIELVGKERAAGYHKAGTVPLMLDADGAPMRRNFVQVDDLVDAILKSLDHPGARQQTFNICMDEPVDYGAVAAHLKATRGLSSVEVPTEFHSTWLDNSKAKYRLGWRPSYDLKKLVDAAYNYVRAANDPRKIWYPG
jgi:nucleoside-diphosphate-sugar epimerase